MRALYRKYRSKSLAEVVGQSHITKILENAIASERISHAYLLTGPRGVGKTSVARILAHEINKLPYSDDSTHLDIIEIDAASNNGVEDVRDLKEKVRLAPVSAEKKVYIIDEVHMLSKPAFNALLKTLEEPPEHVVFILATTDADKLPETIISRTQRFHFRLIGHEDAVKQLKSIAKQEKIAISDEALDLIADHGQGSFRDSISLLDQIASLSGVGEPINATLVESVLGLAPQEVINTILEAIESHDSQKAVQTVNMAIRSGIDSTIIAHQLLRALADRILADTALLELYDGLLEVKQHSEPSLKLISVLAHAASKPKSVTSSSAALRASVREISATIPELEKRATKEEPEAKPAKPTVKRDKNAKPFDWSALIDWSRKHYVALYSVLAKCGYELIDDGLTIYAKNAFYKKKLDDARYSAMLHDCLQQTTGYELTVHIVPTAPPPRDSNAAKVAAIMGGGEEVAIDATS